MPLYEYICRECGRRFEVLQRVGADASGVTCPKCGGRDVAKQHSTFASSVPTRQVARCRAAHRARPLRERRLHLSALDRRRPAGVIHEDVSR